YLGKFSRKEPTGHEKWLLEVRKFYEEHTSMLLQRHSYTLAGTNYVDLIRDVTNIVHVHFCSEVFNLPLKTEENPHGAFTEKQMYLVMAAVFACVFFDVDPEHSFELRQGAHDAIQAVGKLMEIQVQAIAKLPRLSDAVDRISEWWSGKDRSVLTQYGKHMIERLLQTSGMSVQELVWAQIIPTAGSMCANQGQFFGQVIAWLFSDGREHLPVLHELAVQDTPENDEKILRYFLEFSRLHSETGVYRTVAKEMIVEDMDRKVKLNVGDTVTLNFRSASRDPNIFPDPETIKLDRPIESYIHLGQGPHQCLGQPMTLVAMGAILKTLCKLPNLRPAPVWPGPVDSVKKVVKDFSALAPDVEFKPEWQYHCYLLEDWDRYFPFPASLKICYDGQAA
ncbi:heme peroxidase, partial [Aureobasidium melanogenum]